MMNGPEKDIDVTCKKPEGEYPVPEFLAAIDAVYCNYMAWALCEDEPCLADALEMYAKHKKGEYAL